MSTLLSFHIGLFRLTVCSFYFFVGVELYAFHFFCVLIEGWLGSQVVSVLDSGTEGPEFKSQSQRVAVIGKLFTPIVPLFTKQQNW